MFTKSWRWKDALYAWAIAGNWYSLWLSGEWWGTTEKFGFYTKVMGKCWGASWLGRVFERPLVVVGPKPEARKWVVSVSFLNFFYFLLWQELKPKLNSLKKTHIYLSHYFVLRQFGLGSDGKFCWSGPSLAEPGWAHAFAVSGWVNWGLAGPG